VRERMQMAGIEVVVGAADFHDRVTEGVRAWQQRQDVGPKAVTRSLR
jgi:sulfate permease, SulP family